MRYSSHATTLVRGHRVVPHLLPYDALTSCPGVHVYRRLLQLHYRSSSREVRRLEALALSPVYGAFGAVAGAAPAIRAFAAQEHFAERAAAAITAHQRAAITGMRRSARTLLLPGLNATVPRAISPTQCTVRRTPLVNNFVTQATPL